MKVIDINGKERNIKSMKKINHSFFDAVTKEQVTEVFVEVEIIGHNNEWTEWWPLEDFKKFNPERRPRWKE